MDFDTDYANVLQDDPEDVENCQQQKTMHCTDDDGELSEEIKDSERVDSSEIFESIALCNGEKNEHYYKLLASAKNSLQISEEMGKKLKMLDIHLSHKVPESHKIETRLTHGPLKKQKELLKLQGLDLNRKRFVPEEDAVIHTNWEQFCEEYGFEDPGPFLRLCERKNYLPYSQQIKFVQYLGKELPFRTLYSIYARFCKLYKTNRTGDFSKEEDDFIKLHYTRGMDEQAISTLSKVLGRDNHSVWDRIQRLKLKCEGIMKWNLRCANRVVRYLMVATQSRRLSELQGKEISPQIWSKVGRKCGINPVTVKKFWDKKLSTQLFAAKPIYLKELRIHLIERLSRDGVKDWRDIRWTEIAKEDFKGVSPDFLKSVFKKLLRLCYPEEKMKTLTSNIEDTLLDLQVRYEVVENLDDYYLERLKVYRYKLKVR